MTPSTRAIFCTTTSSMPISRSASTAGSSRCSSDCEVLHVRDLLTEVLEDHEVRELIIRETLDVVPLEPLGLELRELPPQAVYP